MRVHVLDGHIEAGKCSDPFACAVAKAVQERIKPGFKVATSVSMLYLSRSVSYEPFLERPLPPEVQSFICKFDIGQPVGSFFFDIDIPEEYLA